VSAVSHEFRSPLTSLTHLTALLRSDFQPTDERRRQYYDVRARATDRLHRFVETLLDFGRMQAGATRYRLVPLDLSPCVSAVVEEFRNDRAAGAHSVSYASRDQIPTVDADPEALSRAIWNLLENAAKYSPDGIGPSRSHGSVQARPCGCGVTPPGTCSGSRRDAGDAHAIVRSG